ncbi:VOC family protein [Nocardia otitidiscaviarum]|uniref:VOC family protein n=1 Tax=Nocardia otitidiscaviarum TaxID=1823 RepID=A0A516NQV8_9NOCA|nr:VOC family protein [Nocardia otitidiscaviarum]MCP9620443.1 VOC family protein [Nocardia otitidiscaviarum]QDP81281.1 VOC family protein [Nocardia otitidiscaviarum]
MPLLSRLGLPGDERAWAALGFTVTDGTVRIGQVTCTFGEPAWGFDEVHADPALLDVPALLDTTDAPPAAPHPNGVTRVDHIVYWVPDLDTAVEDLNAVLGVPPRRRFHPRGPDGPEMAFYRVGEAFIEVVTSGLPRALVGVAFMADDLDATVAAVRTTGGPIGDPKPAVQGGRIASVWRGHVNWGIAFMEK